MTLPPVSVVVVSRGRPKALLRCLTGVSQLYYPCFEICVVTDPGGVAAVQESPWAQSVKLIPFDEANISAARNLGVAQAAGEVVAFIDDDAVPEPTWLTHLCAPFAEDPDVAAAGGFVRGRNGISFQWKAQTVDVTGETHELIVDEVRATILHPNEGRAIKTEGTNMAVRRDLLSELGGFDPAYHYYYDETDLNFRLAAKGCATAIVPLAEVHHGYLPNATRRANRVPGDLFQIGASTAVFLRKHCPASQHSDVWRKFCENQKRRALRFLQSGDLEPRDVRCLMTGLRKGHAEGLKRPLGALCKIPRASEGFRKFPKSTARSPVVVAGRRPNARRLRQRARDEVGQGRNVSLFLFSLTGLYHRVRFHEDGYWEHCGGLFGRSIRSQPLFRITSFGRRLKDEKLRIAEQRRLVDE
ncbi:Glycosyltransferase, GT2 family [Shimia gijangensis]|uniref:Glycosyltransferase, GT2 family n=1 Tax=Shimia gijangensis TaxID=1470563 RepID=A0A1M6MKX9_9RHOB|nr:glycosyltransferase [Shimia gijangensis]SHJ84109.1 Glycosyltransferase, GT2 family [Shimia gijangensis]